MAQRIMKEQEFESDVFDRGTWQKVFQLLCCCMEKNMV